MTKPHRTTWVFLAGLIAGAGVLYAWQLAKGPAPSSQQFGELQDRMQVLETRNAELSDELRLLQGSASIAFDPDERPYGIAENAAFAVGEARDLSQAESKYLMVTFGANWCLDCRTLHRHLSSEPVASYAEDLFRFVFVDVGKLNQNRDVAESVGVSLSRGIPVAIFFDPEGNVIGTTNDGELEPARYYSSRQILKFVRDVAERQRVLAPDSVE